MCMQEQMKHFRLAASVLAGNVELGSFDLATWAGLLGFSPIQHV